MKSKVLTYEEVIKKCFKNPRSGKNKDYPDLCFLAAQRIAEKVSYKGGGNFDEIFEDALNERVQISRAINDGYTDKISPRISNSSSLFSGGVNNSGAKGQDPAAKPVECFLQNLNSDLDYTFRVSYYKESHSYDISLSLLSEKYELSQELSLNVSFPVMLLSDSDSERLSNLRLNKANDESFSLLKRLLNEVDYRFEIYKEYPPLGEVSKYLKLASESLESAMASKDIDGFSANVDKMKWAIINAKPLDRGTASVADLIEVSCYMAKGLVKFSDNKKDSNYLPRDVMAILFLNPDEYALSSAQRSRSPVRVKDFEEYRAKVNILNVQQLGNDMGFKNL